MGKEQKNKTLSMKIMMFTAVAVVIVLGYQGIRLRQLCCQLDQQIKETKTEIAIESKKLEELEKQHEEINSLANIEKVARDQLDLVKSDEIVFRAKP